MLGDFEGLHTRRWLQAFVARGHEMHAISFYPPSADLPGAQVHVLSRRAQAAPGSVSAHPDALEGLERAESDPLSLWARVRARAPLAGRLPPSLLRFVHAWRYRQAGLPRVLESIGPDIFHAHYVVEHGFYGAFAGFHPYVVSAWGSDLFVESHQLLGRIAARRALSTADLATANDPALAARAIELGASEERVHMVRLGVDELFLAQPKSVNLEPAGTAPPTVISDRALEPLYNVDIVLQAFANVRARLPAAQLLVAGDGSQRKRLELLGRNLRLGESLRFAGHMEQPHDLRRALESAHVYVSVPDSDSLSSSTLEAMASGCFPIVSDLASHNGIIMHGSNGLRVQPGRTDELATALYEALTNQELRRSAVEPNRRLVASEGDREKNLLALERLFYRLTGHPVGGSETI